MRLTKTIYIGIATLMLSACTPTIESPTVTNFEECVAAGSPIMESYPRQCRHGDQTFVEETEENTPAFEADQKLWDLMKDFSYAAEEYYKKNGSYAQNLNDYKVYIEDYANDEATNQLVTEKINYTVSTDVEGDADQCYEFSTVYESDHYAEHNVNNGKFVVGNLGHGICKDKMTPNEFDLSKAQVGDEVMGMTIVELDVTDDEEFFPFPSTIRFSGQAEVTGEYTYHDDQSNPFLSGSVCLKNLTEESLARLPKVLQSDLEVSFCLDATEEFEPQRSSGKATIIIDNYYIPLIEAEVWSTATLIEVIEKF